MARFGDKLKALRIERNLTQEELAKMLGTSKQVISRYENNLRSPKVDIVFQYADVLGVPVDYLADNSLPAGENIIKFPRMDPVPLIGTIACGTPILATENIEGNVSKPEHVTADFALRCKGDSMTGARILDGDIVYIRQQPSVENGEIAAVLIGEEATLKRVYRYPDKIVLSPANPAYEPFVYTGEEIESIRILGKAVAFTSAVR